MVHEEALAQTLTPVLNFEPGSVKVTTHGGSGFAATLRVTGRIDGEEKEFFVKKGLGKDAETMFRGEHESLNAIHNTVPLLAPRSYAYGPIAVHSPLPGNTKHRPDSYFLATDFLHLSARFRVPHHSQSITVDSNAPSLPQKLAQLHSTPAPSKDFGFPVSTCCGSTIQNNTPTPGGTWANFYGNNRLKHVLNQCEDEHGIDSSLRDLVERTVQDVVPRLLGNLKIKPVVVHGDLWSGNFGVVVVKGERGKKDSLQEMVFDPSSCYAHSEYEFGIMKMFGGFEREFYQEYWKHKPKDEPAHEWDDRVELYELYHHLNHYHLFGGSYKNSAMSIMRRLLGKYGNTS
ncbi:Fructosamine/Ketosamine-3-kinase [Xylogone sp. PMI_703]|nr:Fructosamine/Ketosamine-3-kinase [Xylogone sp. PMI_703]